MKACRLCQTQLGAPNYRSNAPGLTSGLQLFDVQTEVSVCRHCGLAQSPELANTKSYYDRDYKISLESDDHDQLITLPSGETIPRNDLQSRLVVEHVDLPVGAKVLDFGGAKGSTLKKICALRSDIVPYIFDVSNDYEHSWASWILKSNTAVHEVPDSWRGQVDVVIANFVLEHIPQPVETLLLLKDLLAPDGVLFLTVPNALSNTGDLLVVDHVNHFTPYSLFNLFASVGLAFTKLDEVQLPGGLIAVVRKVVGGDQIHAPKDDSHLIVEALSVWEKRKSKLISEAALFSKSPSAIFGAGFYGNWIASIVAGTVDFKCYLDNNKYLQNREIGTLLVLAPVDMPAEIETIYIGINPAVAKKVVEREPHINSKRLFFLE
jgi:SAM-dependent methyltransferase